MDTNLNKTEVEAVAKAIWDAKTSDEDGDIAESTDSIQLIPLSAHSCKFVVEFLTI